MNYNWEHFLKIAQDFGLNRDGFYCTLPHLALRSYIMKFDNVNKKIYCAEYIRYAGGEISCFGKTELKPQLARKRICELIKQYKNCLVLRESAKIKKDFE